MIPTHFSDPGPGLRRFEEVSTAVRSHNGFASTNLPVAPAPGYDTAEIFLGSRVDRAVDVLHVMSFKQEPDGEHILQETFLRRTERGLGDWIRRRPAAPVVYHLIQERVRGSSGSPIVDAVLAAYDPQSGALRSRATRGDAYDGVEKLEAETGERLT